MVRKAVARAAICAGMGCGLASRGLRSKEERGCACPGQKSPGETAAGCACGIPHTTVFTLDLLRLRNILPNGSDDRIYLTFTLPDPLFFLSITPVQSGCLFTF
jgi:hypothetical protein